MTQLLIEGVKSPDVTLATRRKLLPVVVGGYDGAAGVGAVAARGTRRASVLRRLKDVRTMMNTLQV